MRGSGKVVPATLAGKWGERWGEMCTLYSIPINSIHFTYCTSKQKEKASTFEIIFSTN